MNVTVGADPAEVEAAQKAMGCERVAEICDAHTDVEQATLWTDRGCPVAVSVADAVVAAAEPRIASTVCGLVLRGVMDQAMDLSCGHYNHRYARLKAIRRWLRSL